MEVEWVKIDWSGSSPNLPLPDTMVWIASDDAMLGLGQVQNPALLEIEIPEG